MEVLTSEAVTSAKGYDPKRAAQIYDRMAARPSWNVIAPILRIFRWSASRLFPLGIRVNVKELEKAKATMAKHPGNLVLLPTHRSHIDYLTMHHICALYNLPTPCVVAGDNLNMAVIGPLLRRCGAVFIRRSFGGDHLYTAIFNEYLKGVLRSGGALECFIEGGRGRSGKLLPPKLGFMKCIVEAVEKGDVEDVWILPVSFGYDRLLETESYVEELQGTPKKAERLLSTVSYYWRTMRAALNHKISFGRVDVGIGEPISIQEHMRIHRTKSPSTLQWDFESNSLKSVPRTPEQQSQALHLALAYRSLDQCNQCSTILPAALVGTVMLLHRDRGLTKDTLIEKVGFWQREIKARGFKILEGNESLEHNIDVVVTRILTGEGRTNLMKRHKDLLITSAFTPDERLELSIYRNQIIHIFVLEAQVAVGIQSCLRKQSAQHPDVPQEDLLLPKKDIREECAFLSYLLKAEFVYEYTKLTEKSGGSLMAVNFEKGCDVFVKKGYLEPVDGEHFRRRWPAPIKQSTLGRFCDLLLPFVDSYFLVLLGAVRLLPDQVMEEKAFIAKIQSVGERLYFSGEMDHYEAVGKETLQQAVQRYYQIGVLLHTYPPEGRGKGHAVRLAERFRSEDAMHELIARVHAFRRTTDMSLDNVIEAVKNMP
uniref:Phospholipid/glycerol acyltransferase domain-containing protein n=1 Tax=Eutreptiella gymnastica TaxID=73025 RepID=A0A7S4C879_9EUGL